MEDEFLLKAMGALVDAGLEVRECGEGYVSAALTEAGAMIKTSYTVVVFSDGVVDGSRERQLHGPAREVNTRGHAAMRVNGTSTDRVHISASVESIEQLSDVLRAVRQMRQDGTSSAGLYHEPTRRANANPATGAGLPVAAG